MTVASGSGAVSGGSRSPAGATSPPWSDHATGTSRQLCQDRGGVGRAGPQPATGTRHTGEGRQREPAARGGSEAGRAPRRLAEGRLRAEGQIAGRVEAQDNAPGFITVSLVRRPGTVITGWHGLCCHPRDRPGRSPLSRSSRSPAGLSPSRLGAEGGPELKGSWPTQVTWRHVTQPQT